jgi:hypothetical protein
MNKVMLLRVVLSLGALCWAGSAREDAVDRLNNATFEAFLGGLSDAQAPSDNSSGLLAAAVGAICQQS